MLHMFLTNYFPAISKKQQQQGPYKNKQQHNYPLSKNKNKTKKFLGSRQENGPTAEAKKKKEKGGVGGGRQRQKQQTDQLE